MTLTNLVTSLEWSKKLKAAGVPQESYFWWIAPEDSEKWPPKLVYKTELGAYYENGAGVNERTFEMTPVLYAAYSVAELGEMLPDGYSSWKKPYGRDGWTCESGDEAEEVFGETEANARAAMLHFLITNGLVDVKTLQKKQ